MINDEQLFLDRLHGKERKFFHDLFNDFYKSLVFFSVRYVERPEIAEDIVQDFFAKLWESDTRYSSYNGFRTFMYNSVKNASLDWIRHTQIREKYLRYSLAKGDEYEDNSEQLILEEEIFRTLMVVLEELPDRCKEIFKLHLQGAKNEDIARDLNLSIHTVKTQKKRAVRYFKERMGNLYWLLFILFP